MAGSLKSRVVMTIHDAVYVEAIEEDADQARHLMRRMLTSVGKLRIPVEVDIKYRCMAFSRMRCLG